MRTIATSYNVTADKILKNIKLINYADINAAMEKINVLNRSPKYQPATKAEELLVVNIN